MKNIWFTSDIYIKWVKSVYIDNYHDLYLNSFKFKGRFLLQSESN